MKTYWEKLKDPRWQKKRLEIMQRDDFSCQVCSSKDNTLNVHHRIYRKGKSPWEYEESDLVTLCEKCHGEVTKQNQEINEWLAGPYPIHLVVYTMCQFHNGNMTDSYLISDMMSYIASIKLCAEAKDLASLDNEIVRLDRFAMDLIQSLSRIRSEMKIKRTSCPDYIPPWKIKE